MNLKSLKMLVRLADRGSFSAVAEELDVSQPAVSMQINNLEERFDTELFRRAEGGVELTPAGRIVYRHARSMLTSWQQLNLEINRLQEKHIGRLTVGASTIPSTCLLPALMSRMMEEYPEIEIDMRVGDSGEAISMLVEREVDLIIVGHRPEENSFIIKPVVEDRLELIVPVDDELARAESVKLEDIKDKNFLIREEGSGTRRAMLSGLEKAGMKENELSIRGELESNEAIIAAVEAGLGISFISRLAAGRAAAGGRIERIEVEEMNLSRHFYLAYNREREGERLLEEFAALAAGMHTF